MAESPFFPKDITDPGQVEKISPIGIGGKPLPKESFQQLMQTPSGTSAAKAGGIQSPFDVMQSQSFAAGGANFNTLLAQINSAQMTLGDINNDLQTPNLKLKQSQRWMLKNKLSSANAHLRSVNAKVGGNPGPAVQEDTVANPIARFIAFITDGQRQLEQTQQQIHTLSSQKGGMKPADLLLIQIKLSKAQQQLEYSSVMLSKSVDALRTVMGIQL